MAMKGLSLDGAEKLKKALDAYAKACDINSYGLNTSVSSAEAYGKNTKIAQTMTGIRLYAGLLVGVQMDTIAGYQNQLNQIINKYKKFDNTGNNTIGRIANDQERYIQKGHVPEKTTKS